MPVNIPYFKDVTYCGMMGYIANNVEVFEQLRRTAVLSRDLLPDFSSHSSITKKVNILFKKKITMFKMEAN